MKQFIFTNTDGYYEEGVVDGQGAVRACDASLAPGDLVCESSSITNGVDKVTSNAETRSVIGWVISTPTSTTAEILFKGTISGISGLTKTGKVYLSASGGFGSAIPTGGYIQILGHAIDTDKIDFDPSNIKVHRAPSETPADKTYILVHGGGTTGTGIVNSSTIAGTALNGSNAGKAFYSDAKTHFAGTIIASTDTQELATKTSPNDMFKLTGKDATMDAWIYLLNTSDEGSIISSTTIGSDDPQKGMGLAVRDGKIFYWVGASSAGHYHVETAYLPIGEWRHVAFEKIGTDFYYYLNGTHLGTYSFTNGLNNNIFSVLSGMYTSYNAGNSAAYADEIRLVIGQALYGGQSFTPPSQPYVLV
jgi:hypothetical protein